MVSINTGNGEVTRAYFATYNSTIWQFSNYSNHIIGDVNVLVTYENVSWHALNWRVQNTHLT